MHVVSEWGQHWRPAYGELGLLRNLISTSVPWLGCSATLDPVTLTEVRDLCGFHPSVRIQRDSIDRADIKFIIRPIQHSMNGFRDLEILVEDVHAAVEQFAMRRREDLARKALKHGGSVAAQAVLESTRNQRKKAGPYSRACCHRIPKTIVYIDSIQKILKAVEVLINLLVRAGCSKASADLAVQAYHSELAESDKRRISTEFAKPDSESVLDSSKHRIIVATDAMGMGIDNPDIKLVVQWGIPPSMRALLQRAGRAARGKGVCGKFVWLVPSWCFGPRFEHLPPRSTNKRMTDLERRSVLPRGLWELINQPVCIRRDILEIFGEDCTSYTSPVEPEDCCSKCAGDEVTVVPTSQARRPVKSVQSARYITDAVKAALVKWREAKAASIPELSLTVFKTAPTVLILPDNVLTKISRTAATVKSLGSLARAVSGEWGNLSLYGKEIVDVVQSACLQAVLEKQKI